MECDAVEEYEVACSWLDKGADWLVSFVCNVNPVEATMLRNIVGRVRRNIVRLIACCLSDTTGTGEHLDTSIACNKSCTPDWLALENMSVKNTFLENYAPVVCTIFPRLKNVLVFSGF